MNAYVRHTIENWQRAAAAQIWNEGGDSLEIADVLGGISEAAIANAMDDIRDMARKMRASA